MQAKNVPFEEVYDVLAVRIVFEPVPDLSEKTQCWNIYSMVTDSYLPKPDRLRDWVSRPKPNGYEALKIIDSEMLNFVFEEANAYSKSYRTPILAAAIYFFAITILFEVVYQEMAQGLKNLMEFVIGLSISAMRVLLCASTFSWLPLIGSLDPALATRLLEIARFRVIVPSNLEREIDF